MEGIVLCAGNTATTKRGGGKLQSSCGLHPSGGKRQQNKKGVYNKK